MEVRTFKAGELETRHKVKGSIYQTACRMAHSIADKEDGSELLLIDTKGREMVRFVKAAGAVEARLDVKLFLNVLSLRLKVNQLKTMIRRLIGQYQGA